MTELDIDVASLITDICEQIKNKTVHYKNPKMIGVRTGGEWIANHLHKELELKDDLGVIDISFFRDDFSKMGLNPTVKPSTIPWEIDGQHILLVDDVLYTGRTTRAALNEIFDFGRPASVTLITLLDRKGCRELPIQADITGMEIKCDQKIKVTGPEPLKITISSEGDNS